MTEPKTEYAVFHNGTIISPAFCNPAHALTWAAGRGLCRAVGHGWTPMPEGYTVIPIPTLDIDAIYKNPKVMEKCCGACVEHPCPAERNTKVVHGLALLLMAALPLVGCTTLSPNMQVAEAVNQQVNSAITYEADIEQYGQRDRWVVEPASGKGDCEDYALTKAERLNAGGIVTSVEVCLVNDRVPHAVAVAYEGKEAWVLDNLRPYLVRKEDYTCHVWMNAATMGKAVYHGK
jgi:predicted transglutaminase-like cysteine proteinase